MKKGLHLEDLHDVLVVEHARLDDLLWLVLRGGAPDERAPEVLLQTLVDLYAEVVDRPQVRVEDDRRRIVGQLPFRLRVPAAAKCSLQKKECPSKCPFLRSASKLP